MDCHSFRKQHLSYLDDTLSGDEMRVAQCHVMACERCAAHDTRVRRSLMVARSLPTLEPSLAFQERLRSSLARCRDERQASEPYTVSAEQTLEYGFTAVRSRSPRSIMAVAASAMLGAWAWQGLHGNPTPELSMQPVVASQPALAPATPYITPALMQAMATGNPVWPAAMIIEDASTHFVNVDFTTTEFR